MVLCLSHSFNEAHTVSIVNMFEEIEAIISGKVQQVMYRDFVQAAAVALGVAGFVENIEGGRVRVVAQGTPDMLKSLIDRLHAGSVLSVVGNVAVTWRSPTQQLADFTVRYKNVS